MLDSHFKIVVVKWREGGKVLLTSHMTIPKLYTSTDSEYRPPMMISGAVCLKNIYINNVTFCKTIFYIRAHMCECARVVRCSVCGFFFAEKMGWDEFAAPVHEGVPHLVMVAFSSLILANPKSATFTFQLSSTCASYQKK